MAKNFEQFMAESGRQGELDRLRAIPGEYERQEAMWRNGQFGASDNSYVDAALTASDPLLEAEKKISSYLQGKYGKNWYDIDEEQYRASAEEQYDPYYNAELDDYMTGITRQRERGSSDEEKLRSELTTQTENYVGKAKREIDSALESSKEGFAGAGLYFSGKRISKEGKIGVAGEENIRDYTREQGLRSEESSLRQKRQGEDIDTAEGSYKRNWTADRETNLRQNMLGQEKEEYNKRLYEGIQYGGGDYAGSVSLTNRLMGGM